MKSDPGRNTSAPANKAERSSSAAANKAKRCSQIPASVAVSSSSTPAGKAAHASSAPARTAARAGMIAAVYAALTVLCLTLLQGFAWGPVQLRLSEAVCVLALLSPAAVPGLAIGCLIANLLGLAINGTGVLGLFDVVLGSVATLLGALWMRRFRTNVPLALLGPVLSNALIVAAYLPLMLAAFGFYTIPFTDIDLVGSYPLMYLFGFVAITIGEAIVVYGLGLPLYRALKSTSFFRRELEED